MRTTVVRSRAKLKKKIRVLNMQMYTLRGSINLNDGRHTDYLTE